jgi:hypothetical protein
MIVGDHDDIRTNDWGLDPYRFPVMGIDNDGGRAIDLETGMPMPHYSHNITYMHALCSRIGTGIGKMVANHILALSCPDIPPSSI